MKELKISTKLASAVLGKEVTKCSLINKARNSINITYFEDKEDFNTIYREWNIYEFAYKCKEFILNQKNKDCFYIADQFSLNIESQMGVIKYFWCVLLKNNSRVSPEFKADSELEAIIKACEFILIKKESK